MHQIFSLTGNYFGEFANDIQGYVMPDHVLGYSCHLGTGYNGNCLIFADLKVIQGQKTYSLNKCSASLFVSLESSSSILHTALVKVIITVWDILDQKIESESKFCLQRSDHVFDVGCFFAGSCCCVGGNSSAFKVSSFCCCKKDSRSNAQHFIWQCFAVAKYC